MLLAAYANGYFPMAENRNDPQLHWMQPEMRGIIPLDTLHIPRSLIKFMRKRPFILSIDRVFPQVIRACAARTETWINDTIIALYCELWERGYGHSVECWLQAEDGSYDLVGGLYGLALGSAFFAESMFSRVSGASKVALATLMQELKGAGYQLLDTQYSNPHLKQFGVMDVPNERYLEMLREAIYTEPGKED